VSIGGQAKSNSQLGYLTFNCSIDTIHFWWPWLRVWWNFLAFRGWSPLPHLWTSDNAKLMLVLP
jgi:hypothetical protein